MLLLISLADLPENLVFPRGILRRIFHILRWNSMPIERSKSGSLSGGSPSNFSLSVTVVML